MPAEYYAWIANLNARDSFAVLSALIGLALAVAWSRYRRPDDAPDLSPYRAMAWLGAIFLTGLTLRLINLGANSLWYDEALTALTAQRPLTDILTVARYSNHPPGYYLLMAGWSHLFPFGQPSEWWLRYPSLIFGVVNVILTYHVGRAFQLSRRESLTGAALMAVLPFQLFYSQEARMYQLMLLLAMVAVLAYQQRRWWLLALVGTLGLYTQTVFALFLLALVGLWLLDYRQGEGAEVGFWLAYTAIGVLYLPWALYALVGQLNQVAGGWIPQVTVGSFAYLWHVLLWGEANPAPVILAMPFTLTLVALAFVVAYRRGQSRLLALTLFVPLLGVVASLTVAPIFLPRPFITVTPFLYLLLAVALWRVKGRKVLLTGLTALLVVGLWGYYTNPDLQKWPHHQWAAEIEAQYQPGDAVFYVSHFLPFWWYLPDLPSYFLIQDDSAPNAGFNLSNRASKALGMALITPDQLGDYNRAFVLHAHSPAATPYKDQVADYLTDHNPVVWSHQFINDTYITTGAITLINLADLNLAPPRWLEQVPISFNNRAYPLLLKLRYKWQAELKRSITPAPFIRRF